MSEQVNPIRQASGDGIARGPAAPRHILVVDDESDACEAFRQVLEREGYGVTAEMSAHGALEKIATQDFDLVLTDVAMAEMNGLDLCRRIVKARPDLPVIVMTGRGSMDTVIAALRIGARDFLTKPIDAESLVGSIARSLRHRSPSDETSSTPDDLGGSGSELALSGVVGQAAAIQRIYQLILNLSGSLASVVVEGETGTGKEIIARAIHANSRLASGPFVALCCAAMPTGLLESELFGHARGAFTDAKSAKKGLFLEANGGTLLLDEIGELPLELQPKLLRALQERRVRPLGEHQEIPFDCRIIVATNRDLEVEVREKRFREDLYYRINVVRLTVPPLRERGDDILLLARHFLKRFGTRARRDVRLTPSAEAKLLAYAWPGNVRELENCIERAVALARLDEIAVKDLPDKIRVPEGTHAPPQASDPDPDILPLVELEHRYILRAIRLLGGNKARTAELLGIDRSTLYRRLEQYEAKRSN